jgi:hypothetical protein
MSSEHILHSHCPSGLDPQLWSALLALSSTSSRVGPGWVIRVSWEESQAARKDAEEFFLGEGTAFPELPLGNLDWALDAEERCDSCFRVTEEGVDLVDPPPEELCSPWLVLSLFTSTADPTWALAATLQRRLSARADDLIGRALAPIQRIPLLGDLVVSAACDAADIEHSAILSLLPQGVWAVHKPIRD